jgi:hypothetical protein
VVVELRVVGLDRLEEQVARLLQVRVDRQVERVEVGVERVRGRLGRDRGVVAGQVELRGGGGGRQLVEEGGEEVRVLDRDGDFDEDVLVA